MGQNRLRGEAEGRGGTTLGGAGRKVGPGRGLDFGFRIRTRNRSLKVTQDQLCIV